MDHLKLIGHPALWTFLTQWKQKDLNTCLRICQKGIIRVKACTKLDNEETYSFIEKTPNSEPKIKPYFWKTYQWNKTFSNWTRK